MRLPAFMLHLAVTAALCAGCATPPVQVGDSQLNWLLVTYQPAKGAQCTINLVGVGYIDFVEGSSPLVSDAFSTDVGNDRWQDKYQERLGLQPEEIRVWLQRFVDAGLGQRHGKLPKDALGNRDVAFMRASIDFEKMAWVTDDPELIALVRSLVKSIKTNGGRP
ncbi:MAG: hypothetical protein IJT64_01950 [Kiritimatiellae bacterium]|nr:hypothetical protein [Kiritimatiellia bacterium]